MENKTVTVIKTTATLKESDIDFSSPSSILNGEVVKKPAVEEVKPEEKLEEKPEEKLEVKSEIKPEIKPEIVVKEKRKYHFNIQKKNNIIKI